MNWRKQVEGFKADLKVESPSIADMLLRIGFFGGVGSGKSTTAAMMAIACTPSGLIGIVDGENKRSGLAIEEASKLAVQKYGGSVEDFKARFRVAHISPPFNPLRVIAAGEMLIGAGCSTLVLDILTQVWDSSGGYLDLKEETLDKMTGGDEGKRQKNAQAAAARVKPWTHTKLVHWIDEAQANLILCFQAKAKWNAKLNRIDETETPIQESGITRTALAVGRIWCRDVGGIPQGGFCEFKGVPGATKHTSGELLKLLPNQEQFSFDHAERIVRWWKQKNAPRTAAPPAPNSIATIDDLKRQLWELTAEIHNCPAKADKAMRSAAMTVLQQWAWDESIISDTETLAGLTAERLAKVIDSVKTKLHDLPTP